jgi:hypothetical protein
MADSAGWSAQRLIDQFCNCRNKTTREENSHSHYETRGEPTAGIDLAVKEEKKVECKEGKSAESYERSDDHEYFPNNRFGSKLRGSNGLMQVEVSLMQVATCDTAAGMDDDIPSGRRSTPTDDLLYELLPTGARSDLIQQGIGGCDDVAILIGSRRGNLFPEHLLSCLGFWRPFNSLDCVR